MVSWRGLLLAAYLPLGVALLCARLGLVVALCAMCAVCRVCRVCEVCLW